MVSYKFNFVSTSTVLELIWKFNLVQELLIIILHAIRPLTRIRNFTLNLK